jgi:hypothetical protein
VEPRRGRQETEALLGNIRAGDRPCNEFLFGTLGPTDREAQCLVLGRPSCISTYYIDCKLPTPEGVGLGDSGSPDLDCKPILCS